MRISIDQAAERLPELVRRVQQGEEVVLTEKGADAVRIEPLEPPVVPGTASAGDADERRRFLDDLLSRVRKEAAATRLAGADAAHSQDFLYDEKTGLPA